MASSAMASTYYGLMGNQRDMYVVARKMQGEVDWLED